MTFAKIVLGLVGPSGAGKSTVCRYFEKNHDFFAVHAIAPLKHGFAEIFGGAEFCENPRAAEAAVDGGKVTRRQIMEFIGNGLHELEPRLLPAHLDQRISKMQWHHILVDGIRRTTEAGVVRKHGGKIIRIEGVEPDPNKPCDQTQAEVEADFTVMHGDLAALHDQLAAIAVVIGLRA